MYFKAFLVISCALVVFANNEPTKTSAIADADACNTENDKIDDYKKKHEAVPEPKLEGTFKFVLIYDPAFSNEKRGSNICLCTEFTKDQTDENKVGAKSVITFEGKSKEDAKPSVTEIAEIHEDATKEAGDGSKWKMSGRMVPKQDSAESITYNGVFNFFHNKAGIIGYSACSVDQKGRKGLVMIVSKDKSVTKEVLLKEEDTPSYKSFQEVKVKLSELAKELYGITDISNHEYKTDSLCW